MTATNNEEEGWVHPDGLSIRRRRHDQRWSKRELVFAISEANFKATGLRDTITPNQLQGMEEQSERVPYRVLQLVARGLDCDPVDILAE